MTINQTINGVSRELIEHAIEALTRHLDQHAPMQVPPSKADSDLVREELRALLDAESAPCAKSQVEGKRERFQKWVMATKHPVFGFLDGRSLARGDDRTGYADEYVQGLWVAYLEFGAEHPAPDNALKAFANDMITAAFEGGSFDGGDIQDIAVRHGLLRIEQRTEECGEVCACRSEGDGFPAECYRKTALLRGEQPAPVTVVHPFAEKVIRKLERFQECADDGQGADIGRHWFDLLTQLGLLNRVQRSPALWEMTQQGEDALELSRQSAKSR